MQTDVCMELSQRDRRWHGDGQSFPLGLVVQRTRPGGRRATRYDPRRVALATWDFKNQRTVSLCGLLGPGSYTIVPATLEPTKVATPFLLEIRGHGLKINTEVSDDEETHQDDEDNKNDSDYDALNDNDGSLPLPSVFREERPTNLLEEDDGQNQIASLWQQASLLSDKICALSQSNADVDSRLHKAEAALRDHLRIVKNQNHRPPE